MGCCKPCLIICMARHFNMLFFHSSVRIYPFGHICTHGQKEIVDPQSHRFWNLKALWKLFSPIFQAQMPKPTQRAHQACLSTYWPQGRVCLFAMLLHCLRNCKMTWRILSGGVRRTHGILEKSASKIIKIQLLKKEKEKRTCPQIRTRNKNFGLCLLQSPQHQEQVWVIVWAVSNWTTSGFPRTAPHVPIALRMRPSVPSSWHLEHGNSPRRC